MIWPSFLPARAPQVSAADLGRLQLEVNHSTIGGNVGKDQPVNYQGGE